MMVVRDGTSLMTAGLDHWYSRPYGGVVDEDEFIVHEWRLERFMRVSHFRLPPDFRPPRRSRQRVPNTALTVPFMRFPGWHFCSRCRRLDEVGLATAGRVQCMECRRNRKHSFMAQVPFVAVCESGHIQDFPWREWVHRTSAPTCLATLRLIALGGASLAAQEIRCDGCGKKRNLQGVTSANTDGTTTLSRGLSSEGVYHCRGQKPWLGAGAAEPCDRQLRGSLRGAGNVYFPVVKSALYLPRTSSHVSERLLSLLDEPVYALLIRVFEEKTEPSHLRKRNPDPLVEFTDREIAAALAEIVASRKEATDSARLEADQADEELGLRRAEFEVLRTERADEDLVVKSATLAAYQPLVRGLFSHISLITKLRETRAFAGFSRLFPNDVIRATDRARMLWRQVPPAPAVWLPAQVVHGEGLFLAFKEDLLREWEQREDVQQRLRPLLRRLHALEASRRLARRDVTPRLVMIHTFAHLLLSRLTFECGYSSASLRERLFVSSRPETPMGGLLIFTAAGDSDGTMGGLVRMGRPGLLEPVVGRAIEVAQWCSSDPVCMESNAQGPLSLNMAACHSCALVPETACEEINRFLDRALVVGTPESPALGFVTREDR